MPLGLFDLTWGSPAKRIITILLGLFLLLVMVTVLFGVPHRATFGGTVTPVQPAPAPVAAG